MRTKKIGAQDFTLRGKEEITLGAQHQVERFIASRGVSVMKGLTKEGAPLEQMLDNPDEFVDYLQITQNEKETEEYMAIMLSTGLSYAELEDLPIALIKPLLTEVEKEIGGTAKDFINGLNISITSILEKLLGMGEVQKETPSS